MSLFCPTVDFVPKFPVNQFFCASGDHVSQKIVRKISLLIAEMELQKSSLYETIFGHHELSLIVLTNENFLMTVTHVRVKFN